MTRQWGAVQVKPIHSTLYHVLFFSKLSSYSKLLKSPKCVNLVLPQDFGLIIYRTGYDYPNFILSKSTQGLIFASETLPNLWACQFLFVTFFVVAILCLRLVSYGKVYL